MYRMIDYIDLHILHLVQSNGRISNVEIARQVELAPSAILERVRKLEERGLIKNYTAELDARALGFGLTAYVFVRTEDRLGETAETLAKFPEVQEVHHVAGEDCYLLKVRVRDADALGELLRNRLGALKSVSSTRTTVVLQTVKETNHLPLNVQTKESTGGKQSKKPKTTTTKQRAKKQQVKKRGGS